MLAMTENIEDAEIVEDEVSPVVQETINLSNLNGQRLAHLAMQQIEINTLALALRVFIEEILNEEQRQVLDLHFQQRLSAVLDDAEAQVDRINLERSAQQASGLIVPGGPAPGS
jgi:hypothetical protein